MDDAEAQARREVRAQLVASGCPAAHVDEVVDIGFHAAQAAVNALQSVLFSASDPRITVTATGIALGVAGSRFRALEEALNEIGAAAELPVRRVTIEVDDHG